MRNRAFPDWLPAGEALAHRGLHGHHASIEGWKRWALGSGPAMRHQRAATLVSCIRCGPSTPPEWMLDDDLCQRCAPNDGAVF